MFKYIISAQAQRTPFSQPGCQFQNRLKISPSMRNVSYPLLFLLVSQHLPPFSLEATNGISNAQCHEHYW